MTREPGCRLEPRVRGTSLEHVFLRVGELRLHTVQCGPMDGPLVVLLHGFPEFWFAWREQITALADAGFRVVAPDQRGYNESDKPEGIDSYKIDALAKDVAGLVGGLGRERAFVVGHDWGGAVAWWLAAFHPGMVDRLVIINAPHPQVMWRTLKTSWAQRFKSWYIFFFQLPRLPEWLTRLGDWSVLCRALVSSSREGTFSQADLDRYREAWGRPGACQSMLNWYRAIRRSLDRLSTPPAQERVETPTLMVWGAKDRFLGVEMARPSMDFCSRGELVVFQEATHWVQHEEAASLNHLLISFFQGREPQQPAVGVPTLDSL